MPGAGINRSRQRIRFEGTEEQRETISAASALGTSASKWSNALKLVDWGISRTRSKTALMLTTCSESACPDELSIYMHKSGSRTSESVPRAAGRRDARMAIVWPACATPSDEVSDRDPGLLLQAIPDPGLKFAGNAEEFSGYLTLQSSIKSRRG